MKERGILMSAPMVLATLADLKTQTRRIINPQPVKSGPMADHWHWRGGVYALKKHPTNSLILESCPYGVPGDRLWVREAWRVGKRYDDLPGSAFKTKAVRHMASWPDPALAAIMLGRYRHARFMPRWAARITLEVAAVRVERLQEISEADCCAEGMGSPVTRDCKKPRFTATWETINGPGSWAANPWVWVVEFRRLT